MRVGLMMLTSNSYLRQFSKIHEHLRSMNLLMVFGIEISPLKNLFEIGRKYEFRTLASLQHTICHALGSKLSNDHVSWTDTLSIVTATMGLSFLSVLTLSI